MADPVTLFLVGTPTGGNRSRTLRTLVDSNTVPVYAGLEQGSARYLQSPDTALRGACQVLLDGYRVVGQRPYAQLAGGYQAPNSWSMSNGVVELSGGTGDTGADSSFTVRDMVSDESTEYLLQNTFNSNNDQPRGQPLVVEVICNELSQTTLRLIWSHNSYERTQIDCTLSRGGRHVALYKAGSVYTRLDCISTDTVSTGTGYHSGADGWVIAATDSSLLSSRSLLLTESRVQCMVGHYGSAGAETDFDRWLGDCAHAERMVVV